MFLRLLKPKSKFKNAKDNMTWIQAITRPLSFYWWIQITLARANNLKNMVFAALTKLWLVTSYWWWSLIGTSCSCRLWINFSTSLPLHIHPHTGYTRCLLSQYQCTKVIAMQPSQKEKEEGKGKRERQKWSEQFSMLALLPEAVRLNVTPVAAC